MSIERKSGAALCWLALLTLSLMLNANWATAQDKDKNQEVDLPALLEDAKAKVNEEDFAAAAKMLQQYTKAKDDNGEAWFFLGYSLHMDGKLDDAIVAHKKATKSSAWGPTALYNLGCAYSLKDETDISLEYLHQAFDAGFNRFDMIDSDPDLENVKKVDGFKLIEQRVDNGGDRIKKKGESVKGLVGKWVLTSGTRQGDEIAADRLPEITITERDITIPAGEDGEFVMSYEIVDGSDDVHSIDIKIESGPVPEGFAKGILKMNGNQAKLCYDPTGKERPKKFETTKENGCFMFVMKKKSNEFDASTVIGDWQVTAGTRAGEKVDEARFPDTMIVFGEDKITIPAGEEGEFVMTYTIDHKTLPVQIDMKIESGPAPEGSAALGILKLKDGKFTLCYNATGGERPAKFESTKENGNFLFTMKTDKE